MNLRVNGQIKAPEVRVIWEEGSDVGVFTLTDAFAWVARVRLDLIEIGPWSVPPICLVIDYGMYRWNLAQADMVIR
jgi:translation initiation factor IF-3